MAKQVRMTIEVDSDLWAAFLEAASQKSRAPDQIVQEFIESFVRENCAQHATRPVPRISDEERSRREKEVSFARSSIALEGFTLSDSVEAHTARFVNGDIELPEFIQGLVKADAKAGG